MQKMLASGNQRFHDFMREYKLEHGVDVSNKYMTFAADYYREMLDQEAHVRPLTRSKPNLEEGRTLLDGLGSLGLPVTPESTPELDEDEEEYDCFVCKVQGKVTKAMEKAKDKAATMSKEGTAETIKSSMRSGFSSFGSMFQSLKSRIKSEVSEFVDLSNQVSQDVAQRAPAASSQAKA